MQKVKGFSIVSVSFPNVFDNISARDNSNILAISVEGGPILEIPLDEGWYTQDDLISALKTIIDAQLIAPETVSIAPVSSVDARLRFTTSGTSTLQFFETGLFKILGIRETSVAASIYTCDDRPNLGGTQMAYLHSKTLSNVQPHRCRG